MKKPRAVLYLRQSVSRDDSISLELQENAGRDYAHRQGYDVAAVEADPGVSGRTWKRPAVVRVMAMIEAREADVIVLWKWSRLSRSRRDWAIAVDRVEVAGGRIESATEQVDVTTATGRLARGMLAEFAAFESDRIGEVWREVQGKRLADGYTPNGKPRFGYVWDSDDKIHKPDSTTGPILAALYERYIAGESIYTLARWLNAESVRTTAGLSWSDRSLRRVMDAGFGAGVIRWRGDEHPGRHEALIDAATWQAYRDARVVRKSVPARVKRSQYVLSGLVKCGRCGGSMVANNPGERSGRAPSWRCATAKERGPLSCVGGYVAMRVVTNAVLEWLATVASDIESAAELVDVARGERLSAETEVARLLDAVARTDAAIDRLTLQMADGVVGDAAYRRAVAALEERRAGELAAVDAAEVAARGVFVGDVSQVAADLLGRWETLPVEGRREVLGRLVSRVEVVTGGRSGVRGVQGGASVAKVTVIPVWL